MSQSAVSIAASASEVIAPTAVAWVWKKSAFQISSMRSGSRPISCGARFRAMQLDDGGTAGADGVGVAGTDRAVVGEDPNDRRLLADKGLDRIGPLHLGHEVDHEDLDALDFRHSRYSMWKISAISAHHSPDFRVARGTWQGSQTAYHSLTIGSAFIRLKAASRSSP